MKTSLLGLPVLVLFAFAVGCGEDDSGDEPASGGAAGAGKAGSGSGGTSGGSGGKASSSGGSAGATTSGGTAGSTGSGGSNTGTAGDGAGGDSGGTPDAQCQAGCELTMQADCEHGPANQEQCEGFCVAAKADANCGAEYQELLDCGEGEGVTCTQDGFPLVENCSTEQDAFVACLN